MCSSSGAVRGPRGAYLPVGCISAGNRSLGNRSLSGLRPAKSACMITGISVPAAGPAARQKPQPSAATCAHPAVRPGSSVDHCCNWVLMKRAALRGREGSSSLGCTTVAAPGPRRTDHGPATANRQAKPAVAPAHSMHSTRHHSGAHLEKPSLKTSQGRVPLYLHAIFLSLSQPLATTPRVAKHGATSLRKAPLRPTTPANPPDLPPPPLFPVSGPAHPPHPIPQKHRHPRCCHSQLAPATLCTHIASMRERAARVCGNKGGPQGPPRARALYQSATTV